MRPECVVFDEATAMLDPKGREDVLEIIRLLKEKLGTAVVLITHHMEEAVGADRVVVMSDGRIVMEGRPEEVFSRVEELRSLSLDVPESVALIYELNKEGFDISLENITEEKCAEAIYEALK